VIRVLIADDHPVVREGLVAVLNEKSEFNTIDQAADGLEVLRKIQSVEYDVLVLDLSMPHMDGLETIVRIKSQRPKMAVLILSTNSEEFYGLRCLKMGASGYLSKECAPEQLVSAVHLVAEGQIYLSQKMAQFLARSLTGRSITVGGANLSDREYQIMTMIAEGQSIKQIAAALSLSTKTVSTYRARILRKLHLENNAQLVSLALEMRLPG